jgi:hypothetical protein
MRLSLVFDFRRTSLKVISTANNLPGAGANAEVEATSAATIETLNIIVKVWDELVWLL